MKSLLSYISKDTSNERTIYGYTFTWTHQHLSPEQLEPLRHTYDKLADETLDAITPLRKKGQDLFDLLQEVATGTGSSSNNDAVPPPAVKEFWQEVNSVPEGLDWETIVRGQDVFYRYGGAILTGLCYHSLLGGMGMHKVVETLARTGGFSKTVARRRMYETVQHSLQCTRSLDDIKPGGEGWKSSVRVRLLHAAVRKRILKLEKDRPGYYNVKEWGIPINDLDSIATILSFSATLIWMSLPAQGIFLRNQEIHDYLYLWRLIAHYLGTPLYPFATPSLSKAFMESMINSDLKPTATSRVLSQNIIVSLAGTPPSYASPEFLTAQARWLGGDELCDDLGLMKVSWIAKALVLGQCLFFMIMGYGSRFVESWDKKRNAMLRRMFYIMFISSKHGLGTETKFDMQYIPEYTTKTLGGKQDPETIRALHSSHVERRNLLVLLAVLVVVFLFLGGLMVAVKGLLWMCLDMFLVMFVGGR